MSVLVHHCTTCNHRADMHRQTGFVQCRCCSRAAAPPASSLAPEPTRYETFDARTGKPEPLWAPGSTRNEGTIARTDVCGCDRCREIASAEHGGAS